MKSKGRENKSTARRAVRIFGLAAVASFLAVGMVSYGSFGSAEASRGRSSTVSTHIKDHGEACVAPMGPYEHVWVTITGVKAHIKGVGWKNLTPNIPPGEAMQVDLLSQQSTACFLATVGVASGLPAGKYNQIRIFLEPNKADPSNVTLIGAVTTNQCAPAWNCVVDSSSSNPHTLKLSSEARTGIKIPPGQIAHGGLRIKPDQVADININFNACRSIVHRGNSQHSHRGAGGTYRLKPVLHAGELNVNALVSGMVVEGTVNTASNSVTPNTPRVPVSGANVWLEQQPTAANYTIGTPTATGTTPTTSVENVIGTTTTDVNGNFAFCGIPAGTYEIVTDADSMPSVSADVSDATITTGVTNGASSSGLVIPLVDGGSAAAKLEGVFTTVAASPPGAGDNITFGGVQPLSDAPDAVQAIIPPLTDTMPVPAAGALPFVATDSTSPIDRANCLDITPAPTCTGENCGCFTLGLPAGNPVIGTAAGGDYMASTAANTDYSVTGAAANLNNASTAECTPSTLITDPAHAIEVTGGSATIAPNPMLSFTGCD